VREGRSHTVDFRLGETQLRRLSGALRQGGTDNLACVTQTILSVATRGQVISLFEDNLGTEVGAKGQASGAGGGASGDRKL
jgi:hypothetical protein